jgi:hypothetical protein
LSGANKIPKTAPIAVPANNPKNVFPLSLMVFFFEIIQKIIHYKVRNIYILDYLILNFLSIWRIQIMVSTTLCNTTLYAISKTHGAYLFDSI